MSNPNNPLKQEGEGIRQEIANILYKGESVLDNILEVFKKWHNRLSRPDAAEGVKEESEVPKPVEDFAEELSKAGAKVVFGLQPEHLPIIEKWIAKFGGNVYNDYAWREIGKEIHWDPLTAMCWYFRFPLAASQPRGDVHEEVRTWRSIWGQAYKMGQLDFQKEMRKQFTITRKEKGEAK